MWDERYSGETYAYGTEPNDFLIEMSGQLPTGQVNCHRTVSAKARAAMPFGWLSRAMRSPRWTPPRSGSRRHSDWRTAAGSRSRQ